MRRPRLKRASRSMVFSSSRTLPGQGYRTRISSALGGELRRRLSLGGQSPYEIGNELGDVFPALAKRRNLDGDNVQPVEKVFTEKARVDPFLEVPIGCRDDASVGFERLSCFPPECTHPAEGPAAA